MVGVDKEEILRKLYELGVVGVFRVDTPENCFKAMDALMAGGLNALEITTSTPNAIEVIAEARKKYGDKAILGIGTVTDAETAEKAIMSGAQFVVGPSLHREIIDVCKKYDVISCPGTFTPTEIVQAWKWGADLIKIFPISVVGPAYLKAIRDPMPHLKLVPTGGIDASNAGDYIRAGAYCLGVGGKLVSKKAIAEGRFDLLTEAARELLNAVKDARGR